jgi:hypothetical protein
MLLVCVLACGHAVTPAASPVSAILAGPAVSAESLRVAATDSFGVALAQHLAPGANVRVVSSRGALDFIDGGGDVLVTDRPSVIHYASSRADFAAVPLPWDRQYAFVSANAIPIVDLVDAVHADARPATARCPLDSVERRPTPMRVVYIADDSIGRSLAERLVGLGAARRAVAAREIAGDVAYIIAQPIDGASCNVGGMHAVPLVETRSQLIVRRGAVGVVADSSGRPRLELKP